MLRSCWTIVAMVPLQDVIQDIHDPSIRNIRMSLLELLLLPEVEVNDELGEKLVSTTVFTPEVLTKMVAARVTGGFDFATRLTLDDAFETSVTWAKGLQVPLVIEATDVTRVCESESGGLEADGSLDIDCFLEIHWKNPKARDSGKLLERERVL